jgi:hypothetical protein
LQEIETCYTLSYCVVDDAKCSVLLVILGTFPSIILTFSFTLVQWVANRGIAIECIWYDSR